MRNQDGQTRSGQSSDKKVMQIKVYLVCMRMSLPRPGQPNVQIIAARLTQAAAQAIVDTTPGTYIEKHVAVK